jgi:hypothetical protein
VLPTLLRPSFNSGISEQAFFQPSLASKAAYLRVTLVNANVEVAGTAPL